MTIKALDRRTVLRGMLATGAAVTIPLPLLEIMLNEQRHGARADRTRPSHRSTSPGSSATASLPGRWKPAQTGAGHGLGAQPAACSRSPSSSPTSP